MCPRGAGTSSRLLTELIFKVSDSNLTNLLIEKYNSGKDDFNKKFLISYNGTIDELVSISEFLTTILKSLLRILNWD